MIDPTWIAVDWGTTNLRAWAMGADDTVLGEAVAASAPLATPDLFERALMTLVRDWSLGPATPVIACGMLGAREGWAEAPYRAVPCTPLSDRLLRAPARDPRIALHIVPGLKQDRPADVMRGEETQIAGFLATTPDFDGVIALPGSHTKWARISAGEVVSFQTAMTGELFAALSEHTVLRHVAGGPDWDEDGFAQGVTEALSRPEAIARMLFAIRAETLLDGLAPGAARARLSGLLIGAELASARPYWLGMRVALLGAGRLTGPYAAALTLQGAAPLRVNAEAATRAGLAAAYATLSAAG
ncbi:2-dehydro-3-deoxygalactonokinase [Palleronia sediminis]|uniref:2-dehydro-3-deoxygalactonokinase n=1 Tax=Palleronia sediminis TaxID=2547833 RepID=A0A4R6AQ77_9RHOB|nr:2-dehydro-3-deoxygalactonokinase [Palleronia sediminis]TDL84186.1 2-dehydro-3-deoxygalactonokinase [Palleronia sediminis]